MYFAHAQGRSYTGMAISCADLISICRMHFPGRVISPQGSAGGWHESRQLQSHPHHPKLPPTSPTVDNHWLASRMQQIQQPFLITLMSQVADWLSGCNRAQRRLFFLSCLLSFFGFLWHSFVSGNLVRLFWNANYLTRKKILKGRKAGGGLTLNNGIMKRFCV